uniref:DUF3566 domain-containing protein n=1 Tax=Brevibacterium litoralis TaxID=3138935 RepID=UPI0032ED2C7B
MSENEKKPEPKVIRASSGGTRLTASGEKKDSDMGKSQAASSSSAGSTAKKSEDTATKAVPAVGSGPTATKTSGSGAGGAGASAAKKTSGSSVRASSGGVRISGGSSKTADSADATKVQSAVKATDTATSTGSGPAPAAAPTASAKATKAGSKKSSAGPRTVKLQAAAIEPWSVAKMAALLSFAIAIITIVASIVVWLVLQATGVIGTMHTTISEIAGPESAEQLLGLVSFRNVFIFSALIGIVNMVLMTALAT